MGFKGIAKLATPWGESFKTDDSTRPRHEFFPGSWDEYLMHSFQFRQQLSPEIRTALMSLTLRRGAFFPRPTLLAEGPRIWIKHAKRTAQENANVKRKKTLSFVRGISRTPIFIFLPRWMVRATTTAGLPICYLRM